MYQLLSSISYLHSQNIAHTNIKLDTLLISYDKIKSARKKQLQVSIADDNQFSVQLQLMSFDNAI